ncbi:putative oxidoreductase YrbE-like [Tropilaelaps mercedesae]|uniref:Putative oxidoreductase YrbE-like n=1 Tax=Tropilaelaps mercedesae TaxID=418985 RepID=A0A1V9XIM0_9ACAR|nr:putative oxidoreductase YrbE-like [Tropilaelaps mercedesae]
MPTCGVGTESSEKVAVAPEDHGPPFFVYNFPALARSRSTIVTLPILSDLLEKIAACFTVKGRNTDNDTARDTVRPLENPSILSCARSHLYYIVEDSSERRRSVEARYRHKLPDAHFIDSTDCAKLLSDKNVQAVLVCTPTFTHKEIVCKALAAGKHVFCEKPIAQSNESVRECYEQAKLHGVNLFCAFNRRYDPGLRKIKNSLMNGELGDVFLVKTTSRDSPIPSLDYLRTSGGIFHDCAVHDIDVVCWLLGEKPVRVQVFGSLLSPALQELHDKDFDTVVICFHFASGKLAIIDLSRNACYGYDQRCEVFGSKGMLQNANHRPNGVFKWTPEASSQDPILYSFASRYQESYETELDYFLNLVSGRAEMEISQDHVLAVTRIASACEKSAKTGVVVELEW